MKRGVVIATLGSLIAVGALAAPAKAGDFAFGFSYGRPAYYGGYGVCAPVYVEPCAPVVVYREPYCAPAPVVYRTYGYRPVRYYSTVRYYHRPVHYRSGGGFYFRYDD